MIKLIKLEWKKNNIAKYMRGAVILAAFLCLFVFALAFLGIANDPDGTLDAAEGMGTISAPIELFTSMSFLIFTSVMLASFIVSAYKNKTMNLMFSYPIKRQKILASQMIAVWLFNFAALVVTKLLIYACVSIGSLSMENKSLVSALKTDSTANVNDTTVKIAGNTKLPANEKSPIFNFRLESPVKLRYICLKE